MVGSDQVSDPLREESVYYWHSLLRTQPISSLRADTIRLHLHHHPDRLVLWARSVVFQRICAASIALARRRKVRPPLTT